ncbi:MAG: DEAD/DEAH box helicase, partial [Opitutales bacterium]
MSFAAFFHIATEHDPYPWQARLADDPACQSRLIDIPTGLGKTAGVILAWLWNCVQLNEAGSPKAEAWPRRLVYGLPMRTLVEQTEQEAKRWVENLAKSYPDTIGSNRPRVVVLMGGEQPEGEERDWDLHPEEPAILIGTQDMLLSRALNRGYGMSRYRWPMHFALLNNDALWVMDEVQLMGVGVETSAQLQGLRAKLETSASVHTWWMSATLDPRQLATIDFCDTAAGLPRETLDEADRRIEAVIQRETALKPLQSAESAPASAKNGDVTNYCGALAAEAVTRHREQPDRLTLVIVNRVPRAQEIFQTLAKELPPDKRLLIHSRFREQERAAQRDALGRLQREGGIVVDTQAIEAGVD